MGMSATGAGAGGSMDAIASTREANLTPPEGWAHLSCRVWVAPATPPGGGDVLLMQFGRGAHIGQGWRVNDGDVHSFGFLVHACMYCGSGDGTYHLIISSLLSSRMQQQFFCLNQKDCTALPTGSSQYKIAITI
ncbi:hypothetical protein E2562_008707 [Oryza meyeriana var. granulata]|uniref:Uncharacterized protein n=1 Tax=Oryza meyeriana var. granulata TaxID=110450 RepID=A0A6G1F5I1_9ORYZ|nr:hypothetical protein E2562_008707 [Oryza meyeriana var. granulata]